MVSFGERKKIEGCGLTPGGQSVPGRVSPHVEKVSQDNEGNTMCSGTTFSQEEVDVRYTQAGLIVACVYLGFLRLCISVSPWQVPYLGVWF